MKVRHFFPLVLVAVAQARDPSPRQLVNAPRALSRAEIATVLERSQDALTGKTLKLLWIGGIGRTEGGPDITMGPRGGPQIVRWAGAIEGGMVGGVVGADGKSVPLPPTRWRGPYIDIIHFTGRPAARCDGSATEEEVVLEYRKMPPSNDWSATARARVPGEFGGVGIAPVFQMLQGGPSVSSGERSRINGRWARAFVSSWTPPRSSSADPPVRIGDPVPNIAGEPVLEEGLQKLWIDVQSLLPLRWQASIEDSAPHGFDFVYGVGARSPPSDVVAPDCIR